MRIFFSLFVTKELKILRMGITQEQNPQSSEVQLGQENDG